MLLMVLGTPWGVKLNLAFLCAKVALSPLSSFSCPPLLFFPFLGYRYMSVLHSPLPGSRNIAPASCRTLVPLLELLLSFPSHTCIPGCRALAPASRPFVLSRIPQTGHKGRREQRELSLGGEIQFPTESGCTSPSSVPQR